MKETIRVVVNIEIPVLIKLLETRALVCPNEPFDKIIGDALGVALEIDNVLNKYQRLLELTEKNSVG